MKKIIIAILWLFFFVKVHSQTIVYNTTYAIIISNITDSTINLSNPQVRITIVVNRDNHGYIDAKESFISVTKKNKEILHLPIFIVSKGYDSNGQLEIRYTTTPPSQIGSSEDNNPQIDLIFFKKPTDSGAIGEALWSDNDGNYLYFITTDAPPTKTLPTLNELNNSTTTTVTHTKSHVNIQFGDVLMQTKTFLLKKELSNYQILENSDSSITFQIDDGYILGVLFNNDEVCRCIIITATGQYEDFFLNSFNGCKAETYPTETKWHCNGYLITHLNPKYLKDGDLGKDAFVFVVQADSNK